MRIKLSFTTLLVVFVLGLLTTIAILTQNVVKYRNLSDRNFNNYTELQDSVDRFITITQSNFNDYLDENVALKEELKKEKIKKSKVRVVTNIQTVYSVDTVEVVVGKFDITKKAYPISFNTECLDMNGYVDVDSIVHVWYENVTYKNTTTVICYEKKKSTGRKFLFFNIKKKYLELHTTNTCGTSSVEQLNVVKK